MDKSVLEIILAAIPAVIISTITIERALRGRGIGLRVIQLATVVLVVPLAVLLTLEDKLDAPVSGLLGAATGYVLSGIGKDEPDSK